MSVSPISALPSLPSLSMTGLTAAGPAAGSTGLTGAAGATAVTAATGGNGFSSVLGNAIDSLQQVQSTASVDEANAAAGQGSLTDTMIAASEASLDTQVATSLINKGLAAYTSIANMTA